MGILLYYRVVVIKAPLQGRCYTVRDAVDWCDSPTTRWFSKGSNHSPYTFVNQLNTARRFMWNKATKVRRTVDAASDFALEVFVMVVSIGIDVSKDKHDCFIVSSEGKVLAGCIHYPQYNGWVQLPVAENPGLHHTAGQNESRA